VAVHNDLTNDFQERLWRMNPDKRDLIRTFMNLADEPGQSPFVTLLHLWMAFNAFGSAVSRFDTDRQMVNFLGRSQQMQACFENLRREEHGFGTHVNEFVECWPIFSESDAFEAYREDHLERTGKVARFPDENEMRRLCHEGLVRENPRYRAVNWRNVLNAIYTVRCNLVHGGKTPVNERDVQLVELSRQILGPVLSRTVLG
jgi:hypothetical protein